MGIRIKRFAAVPDPENPGQTVQVAGPPQAQAQQAQPAQQGLTAKDLQLEQMRRQRQLLITQRQIQKLQEQERRTKLNNQVREQKMAKDQNDRVKKNQVDAARLSKSDDEAKHINLYKRGTGPVDPKSMK